MRTFFVLNSPKVTVIQFYPLYWRHHFIIVTIITRYHIETSRTKDGCESINLWKRKRNFIQNLYWKDLKIKKRLCKSDSNRLMIEISFIWNVFWMQWSCFMLVQYQLLRQEDTWTRVSDADWAKFLKYSCNSPNKRYRKGCKFLAEKGQHGLVLFLSWKPSNPVYLKIYRSWELGMC